VLEIDENSHYTKRGFHLQCPRKKMVSLNLAHLIFSLIKKKRYLNINIIPIGYYEVQSQLTRHSSTANHTLPQNTVEGSKSKHIRKKPVTKTNDFLWDS
jgi:hypothetical protein